MGANDNRIQFGVFELRRDSRELFKHGIRLKLEDQPFAVLLALLENPGAVVTRVELRARTWPDGTFVDFDKSLTKAVNKIRTVLDDSAATPRYIETLSRRGYRFIAPLVAADEPAPPVPEPAVPPAKSRLPRWTLWVLAGLTILSLLVLAMAVALSRRWLPAFKTTPPIQSLAVLPVVNLTGDPGQEYFADGLTDDLISDLSRMGSLRVISYTSAMHYKGAQKALPEIARELRVDAIVEGSVQRDGSHLRINAKLLRAAADRQLWSDSYAGETAATAQLEGRVALAVAHQISAHLTAETTARVAGGEPANQRAYDAYLHGRYLWNLRGPSIVAAAAYFRQAVQEDPGFALAWSGLADTYTIGWHAKTEPALAEEYARKALSLDPGLAEAHISLGFAQYCSHRFADAEKELKRGIELNPNYVAGHQLYATYLLSLRRPAEALTESDQALQLDPFSLPVNNMRGLVLLGLHRYDRAEEQFQAAARADPQSSTPPQNLARIYWIRQSAAEALAAERKAASLGSEPRSDALLRGAADVEAALAKYGFRAACLRLAQVKEQIVPSSPEIPLLYGLVGEKQKALSWLERAAGRPDYGVFYMLETAPELDPLRSDPRFRILLQRLGLPL